MTTRVRVPHPLSRDIIIRLAECDEEIDASNWLVFQNYVEQGYWENDIKQLVNNKWLYSPFRDVFVAVRNNDIVATVSIIRDSESGLPSDSFQPAILRHFRRSGDRLAEVSALAVRKDGKQPKSLPLYLMSCYMQYSFYYTDVNRLVKACKPNHANFYSDILRFEKLGPVVYNSYARTAAQFLSMDLYDAHRILNEYYGPHSKERGNFYRFLLVDENPSVQLPVNPRRSRAFDWTVNRYVGPPQRHMNQTSRRDGKAALNRLAVVT